ncbi:MAG: hypothetical protein LBO07_03780 [Coriobacteriales bacterium]|jgi:biotin synthase|nr:hypothetical protein [Coriobacteriales bacterium]
MTLDARIAALVDKAVADEGLSRDEMELLYAQDEHSPEAFYLRWGAHQIARQASGGRALIYAQLGIDAKPCPGDCAYCSFALSSSSVLPGQDEMPRELIFAYCSAYAANGVHLISLMSTDSYDFESFCEIVSAVRKLVGERVLLMANIGDFDLAGAHALKAAGADAAYHALRLGEGRITAISEQRRRQTIEAILQSGLKLMSGVEPIYTGQDAHELLDRMEEVASWPQICSGLCQLRRVAGTPMEKTPLLSTLRYQQLGALFRLIAGRRIAYGSLNTAWCSAGTNPRDTRMFPGAESMAREVAGEVAAECAARRAELESDGWQVR